MWFIFHREQSHSYGKRTPKHILQMSGKITPTEADVSSFLLLLSLRGFESLSKYVHR